MATESDVKLVQQYYGTQAEAGTYTVGGKEIEYEGPGSTGTTDSNSGGAGGDYPDTVDDKKTTPDTWDGPLDAREYDGAGQYPNYYSHKTRSGHVFMMDDSNGAEHVTMQHRSGSMVQFLPDGKINITAHNGQYNIVFGENRMMVTGASDVTVEGDASLKVKGDYNVAVQGDVNFSAQGDINWTAANISTTARQNIDISGQNRTEKIIGTITQNSQGPQNIIGGTAMSVVSTIGQIFLHGGTFAVLSAMTNCVIESLVDINLNSTARISLAALGGISEKAGLGISQVAGGLISQAAGGAISQTAGAGISISAGAALNLQTAGYISINSGAAVSIAAVGAIGINSGAAMSIDTVGALGINAAAAVDILGGGAVLIAGGATVGISAGGPLILFGTPIIQNVAPAPAVPVIIPPLPFTPVLPPVIDPPWLAEMCFGIPAQANPALYAGGFLDFSTIEDAAALYNA
jgi:hypothetical protein